MKKKKPRSVIMGRHFAGYLGVAVVAMTTTIWGTFDPSVMYYNTSNGNFGLGTEAPQTYLHLKNQNPVITLMTTSAGQTVDNNGTNNGWMGLLFMSPTTNGGTARTKWDMTYSARDQQLYFYDYNANRKTLMLPDAGMPVINGGLVVSGSVGIGTQTPDAALHVAQFVRNGEYLAQHLQNLGGGTAIVTFKIGEGTPEAQYGILGHYGADNSFRIGAVGPSGNHSLQFHTGNTTGTQLSSERMRITAAGNVGVGTMTPTEKLEVAGNVKATQFIGDGSRLTGLLSSNSSALVVSGDGTVTLGRVTGLGGTNTANAAVKVYQSSNTDWTAKFVNVGGSGYGILIQTGAGSETPLISAMDNYGNSRMYLTTTGKLGIGTTQPTEKLDVVGNIQLSNLPARVGVAVADTFVYDGDALANYGLSIYNDTTGFPAGGTMVALAGYRGVRFFAGGRHAMGISGAGNVGIGTTTAGTPLTVSGNSFLPSTNLASVLLISGGSIGIDTHSAGIGFRKRDSSADRAAIAAVQDTSDEDNLGLSFFTHPSTTGSDPKVEALRISSAGNVGIGVKNPDYKLTVNGGIKCSEVVVTINGFADFVFEPQYRLRPLEEVDRFIKKFSHLPDFPSESEIVENGMKVSEIQIKSVQKIEELTLYAIKQDEKIRMLERRIEAIERYMSEKKDISSNGVGGR